MGSLLSFVDENNFVFEIAVELPKPSQSHYMALDDRSRSRVIADASPLSTEQISEYASLNLDTRSWEIVWTRLYFDFRC